MAARVQLCKLSSSSNASGLRHYLCQRVLTQRQQVGRQRSWDVLAKGRFAQVSHIVRTFGSVRTTPVVQQHHHQQQVPVLTQGVGVVRWASSVRPTTHAYPRVDAGLREGAAKRVFIAAKGTSSSSQASPASPSATTNSNSPSGAATDGPATAEGNGSDAGCAQHGTSKQEHPCGSARGEVERRQATAAAALAADCTDDSVGAKGAAKAQTDLRRLGVGDTLFGHNVVHDRRLLFDTLGLSTFSEKDIRNAFDRHDRDRNGTLTIEEVRQTYCELVDSSDSKSSRGRLSVDHFTWEFIRRFDPDRSGQVSWEQFHKKVTSMAETVDRRVTPIAVSMLFTGVSVGVMIPAMPALVEQLGLNSAEFGLVISAFGLSKLLGNLPSAILVQRYGRKPFLCWPLGIMAVGTAGLAFSTGLHDLMMCRLLTGLGVAMYTTAAVTAVTDLSTPLNRTRTAAPIMAGFSAGAALGPAVGGALCEYFGPPTSFAMVAGLFSALGYDPTCLHKGGGVSVGLVARQPSLCNANSRLPLQFVVLGAFWLLLHTYLYCWYRCHSLLVVCSKDSKHV
eukprot:m.279187 g.279187  ORF g.279187 m.279187 type:complete len:563 (-) comp19386_c0_seq2:908-2596(-)